MATDEQTSFPTISGKWLVIGMFAFAITATAILWYYWTLHTAPFIPLQRAIVDEFADSAPRVEGGQRKIHKGTPRILRVTMKVGFNPQTDEEQAAQTADRIVELADEHLDLADYDQMDLHLLWLRPEQELVTAARTIAFSDEGAAEPAE